MLRARLQLLACITALQRLIVAEEVYNRYSYCTRYYGSVKADINLEGVVQEYNYNGTILCPDEFELPNYPNYLQGATLDICPPLDYDNEVAALEVRLSYSDTSYVLSGPIDNLDIHDILITNGSVTQAFENNALPAILQWDEANGNLVRPTWTVNGTQSALSSAPDADDYTQGVYFDCDYNGFDYYCGNGGDEDDGGCFLRQSFYFNMQSRMNFTIRFSDGEATFEIWAEQEYWNAKAPTGKYTKAYVSFAGNRQLPSIVDYDFWENTMSNYETEQEFLSTRMNLRWEADEQNMP
jgi:hypothetical protein